MAIHKLPEGTRGRGSTGGFVGRLLTPVMIKAHRRGGDRFNGMDLLYLTTTGAQSGRQRRNPVARFDDGAGGWYVVASAGGARVHPGWYHNVVAHPDQVRAEVSGTDHPVDVRQLEGAERDAAWARITEQAPGFKGYETKTDRQMPVLRLTPRPG